MKKTNTATKTPLTKTRKRDLASLCTIGFLIVICTILYFLFSLGVINQYYCRLVNNILVAIVAAVSLNMVTGLLGQLVLGQAGFMSIGAYTAALLVMNSNWPLWLAIAASLIPAGLFAAFIGFLIGIPALRLRGDYLAIITLGFGEIIRVVANNLPITHGALGLSGIPSLTNTGMFVLLAIVAIFVVAFSYTFGTSRHGRAVIAIREDEIAAESSGIRTTYYKMLTFTLSAFFGGVAGALYAFQAGVIAPNNFDFNRSIEILMMVVLGGMGSITGSVISASVLTALPEMLRGLASYRMIIYSILLILVMLFRPKGLLGRRELHIIPLYEKWRAKRAQKKAEKAAGEGGGAT